MQLNHHHKSRRLRLIISIPLFLAVLMGVAVLAAGRGNTASAADALAGAIAENRASRQH